MRVIAPKHLSFVGWLILTSFAFAGFIGNSAVAMETAALSGQKVPSNSLPEPTILVLGDSLSAAYNMPREKGWVHLLRERLQKIVPGATVVNGSVSGATTAAGLQVLPQKLKEHQPDLVILELGGNDGLQGKPIPHITRNLRQMIKLSEDAGANVILVGVRLPPNYGAGYTEPFFNQYAQLANEYTLPYVPFILEGVAAHESLMQEDGIHPLPQAQPKLLENVWPAVVRALGVSLQAKAANADNEKLVQ
jgi:acyl-CoA thioesterase-1